MLCLSSVPPEAPGARAMKEEASLRRRFSLCPPSAAPQKAEPRGLDPSLPFGGESELRPLSPGQCAQWAASRTQGSPSCCAPTAPGPPPTSFSTPHPDNWFPLLCL